MSDKIKEALVDYELRFHALFEQTHDAVFLLDLEGNHLEANQRACEMFGYEKEEMLKLSYKDVSLKVDSSKDNLGILLREGTLPIYESLFRKKDGSTIPVEINAVLVNSKEGRPLFIQSALRDISDRKNAENEIIKAKTEAQVANKVKGNFLANMSHEFRTPLNGVIGMMGLLHKTNLDQKQKDYLDKALEFSRLLLHILNDILDFSKIEAGMLILEKTRFELHKVIEDVNAIVSPAIFDKGLSLTVTIPKNVPECLIGDGLRIRQILINLMSNAVKFTDKGKVGITVEMGEAIDAGRSWFSFEIMDTGIGMDQSEIEHIFSPFVQADSSVTRQYGGTGLGLAIVKELVQLMEGTVSLESHPGSGSIFRVMIPLEFIEGDVLDSWTIDAKSGETAKRVIVKAPLRRRSDPEVVQVRTRDELLDSLIEALMAHKPKQCLEKLGKLEIYFLRFEDQQVMGRIKVLIKNYKFDEALVMLKSLQGGIFK